MTTTTESFTPKWRCRRSDLQHIRNSELFSIKGRVQTTSVTFLGSLKPSRLPCNCQIHTTILPLFRYWVPPSSLPVQMSFVRGPFLPFHRLWKKPPIGWRVFSICIHCRLSLNEEHPVISHPLSIIPFPLGMHWNSCLQNEMKEPGQRNTSLGTSQFLLHERYDVW